MRLHEDLLTKCEQCGIFQRLEDVRPLANVRGLHERLAPGEPVPFGECRECGDFVVAHQPTTNEVIGLGSVLVDALTRFTEPFTVGTVIPYINDGPLDPANTVLRAMRLFIAARNALDQSHAASVGCGIHYHNPSTPIPTFDPRRIFSEPLGPTATEQEHEDAAEAAVPGAAD